MPDGPQLVGSLDQSASEPPFPAAVTVIPAASAAAASRLSVETPIVAVRGDVVAVLIASDAFGNLQNARMVGTDSIRAKAEAVDDMLTMDLEVQDQENAFLLSGRLTRAGDYLVKVNSVSTGKCFASGYRMPC